MNYNQRLVVLIAVISFAFFSGVTHYRKGDRSRLLLLLYTGRSLLTEIAAAACALGCGNNLWIYTLSEPLGLLCACCYFESIAPPLKKYRIGQFAGAAALLLQASLIICRKIPDVSGLFEQYECTVVTVFSLISCYYSCRHYGTSALCRHPECPICLLFLLFFAGSFVIRAYPIFISNAPAYVLHKLYYLILLLNILFYTGTGLVFIFCRSRKRNSYV